MRPFGRDAGSRSASSPRSTACATRPGGANTCAGQPGQPSRTRRTGDGAGTPNTTPSRGDARAEHPVPVDMVQAHQRRRRRRQARRDALSSEQEAQGPEAASRHDGPRTPHDRRQARRGHEPQQVRALRDGHRRLVDERDRRTARPRRPPLAEALHREGPRDKPGGGHQGAQAPDAATRMATEDTRWPRRTYPTR